jgi:hypothetical protein
VLVGASLLATITRFALYRNWVFRGGCHRSPRFRNSGSYACPDQPGSDKKGSQP